MGDGNISQEDLVKAVMESIERANLEKEAREKAEAERIEKERIAAENAAIKKQFLSQSIEIYKEDSKNYVRKALKKLFFLAVFWGVVLGMLAKLCGKMSNWTGEDVTVSICLFGFMTIFVFVFVFLVKNFGGIIGFIIFCVVFWGFWGTAGMHMNTSDVNFQRGIIGITILVSGVILLFAIYNIVRCFTLKSKSKKLRLELEHS